MASTDDIINTEHENLPTTIDIPKVAKKYLPGPGPEYDQEHVDDFIDMIFGGTAGVLCWASAGILGYPMVYDRFTTAMSRSRKPKACYFGTARMKMHPDGGVYNRQALFDGLYCIVLDDIGSGAGSKCSVESLPKALRTSASWVIETSPDNFQYGYLLKDPIEDLEIARAFVRVVYASGPWDGGGALPNKLVRLPCGVNTKAGYAVGESFFQVRTVSDNMFEWTPEDLLKEMDAGVSWAEVQANTTIDVKHTRGATAYRVGVQYEGLNGLVDEVLEWLGAEDMLLSESDEWQTIRCPWHREHTDGRVEAYYSPLGCGGTQWQSSRGFHCFHDHCKNNTIADFLPWIAEQGGPEASISVVLADMLSRYAIDIVNKSVVDLKSPALHSYPLDNFKAGKMERIFYYARNGKPTPSSHYSHFMSHPDRIVIHSHEKSPGEANLSRKAHGEYCLNSWRVAQHRTVTHKAAVEAFKSFLAYLLPNDHVWFIKHLAMKVQNPTYRGPGCIIWTSSQGTGRGRLVSMIAKLWGSHNVSEINMRTFVSGINSADFNDWICAEWINIREAEEAASEGRRAATAYETLKDFVDQGAVNMLVKKKWGGQWKEDCFGSVIVCSNHRHALRTAANDRRFKRIEAAAVARPSSYFEKLVPLVEGNIAAIHTWLVGYDLEGFSPFAHEAEKNSTADGLATTVDTKGLGIDAAIEFLAAWSEECANSIIIIPQALAMLRQVEHKLRLDTTAGSWEDIVTRHLRSRTKGIKRRGVPWQISIDSVRVRPRVWNTQDGVATARTVLHMEYPKLELLYSIDSFEPWLAQRLSDFEY